ncbi:MAG: type II 3-dehydroquinate dehydratase [Finegoldia magna]|uniref:type II 3-dehydroquinate dehydratase n=1 Tax=Finegoldia magna TaxID=1260 RepID=UPI000B917CB3|nr:type II 3-dehydroquinate dehydratase [Finegoldia magna]MDU1010084.1 type II 3-dehydroquinate dehydratase [Finegoldia magna]MDU1087383.1 type II 3-dehydroquinate dehydratase [Finegoldia magna]MDU1579156.1 type II 3-dehydroquinate dehydratase [Finegoldia magna]MDU1599963.1 type II 3-dehydroquinate dehydratase [Finegoldia magna]MDU7890241.1 type II 3-dehydroquinate dehydratase [Finegoldia magna]
MKLFIINGPNLNMLGIREPEIYGKLTLQDIESKIKLYCAKNQIDVEFYQSNHEGEIVDIIQSAYKKADGIIINPAAYTHTSVAILDALKAVDIDTVEVHLSDVDEREDFRKFSFVSLFAKKVIKGKGADGYIEAIDFFLNRI